MSVVHIAFYPSDWLAGTRGLSDAETGVYITLIARMYEMAGPIERDDARLARLCGSKTKNSFLAALEYLISEGKITETDAGLFNDRVQKEIEIVTGKSSKAKTAAEARWSKKSNKNSGGRDASASVEHMPQQCQSEPESDPDLKEDTNVSSKSSPKRKPKTALKEGWTLPKLWGEWALSEGWPESVIRNEAARFYDYWFNERSGEKKADWQATWRNWMRKVSKAPVRSGNVTHFNPDGRRWTMDAMKRRMDRMDELRKEQGFDG
jgi:uncharacterized protein YdaU (DUF1376 family)